MFAFECRVQFLSFFILAAATQKSSIILEQSNIPTSMLVVAPQDLNTRGKRTHALHEIMF